MDFNLLIDWVVRIGISIIVFIIAKIIGKIIYKSILKVSEKTEKINLQYKNTMKTLINLAMYSLAVFITISVLFKDLAPVLAGLGVSGIIIGLAVKEPLENMICGILIMVNKLIVEEEAVDINGTSGVVKEIKLNHVHMNTFDGKSINMPSKFVWGSTIVHFWPQGFRRNEINVGVAYNSDLQKVLELLNKAVNSYPELYKDENHNPVILFTGFGTSSIDFSVKYWVEKDKFLGSQFEIAKIIKNEFDSNGIEIPFNQLDVYIKK